MKKQEPSQPERGPKKGENVIQSKLSQNKTKQRTNRINQNQNQNQKKKKLRDKDKTKQYSAVRLHLNVQK